MRTTLLSMASIVALTTLLSACGQKGPLYLPQDPASPTTSPASATHSHGQPAGKRSEETEKNNDPGQQNTEQQSEQHTEAEAVSQ
ncbi:LPS translocon maturation chaperone LptM [Microbulbifer pacificus]|uniref:Lipoprotein n=1 Tax=Microbulbifer pacificus TaxID=407164 RepID=A0AAU0N317_9GAMM|nr:lipoprotein [Microbulbifer pacificus]WOX07196.1 lipoprotein [Microbulbifer pacificus]